MELFNNSYLPDRLDVSPNGQQSIFFHEFLEAEKRANNHSFINRVINRIKNIKGA